MRKDKWRVYGEYGGTFTNLKEAKRCAREASKSKPGWTADVWLIEDDLMYFQYLDGTLIYDGWSKK